MIVIAAAAAANPAQPGPTALFENGTIRISGITPGGDVVVLGSHRERVSHAHGHTTSEKHVVTDHERSGTVVFTPRVTDPGALWVFVDQTTGAFLVTRASGPESLLRLPPEVAQRVEHPEGDRLAIGLHAAEVILIAPGEGAWLADVFDGGGADHDQLPNGAVMVSAATLKPLKKHKSRTHFKGGDVIIVVEPGTLRVLAGRLR